MYRGSYTLQEVFSSNNAGMAASDQKMFIYSKGYLDEHVVMVDSGNTVAELSESNNSGSLKKTCSVINP